VACCALCGETGSKPIIREGEWQYRQCDGCGLVFLHPQPTPGFLDDHYQAYLSSTPETIAAWRRMMEPVHRRTESLIRARLPIPGRLLDVGCGYGFFLDHMSRRGWQVEGIEISAPARRHARAHLGIDVSPQSLPRPDWVDGTFDVVSLLYVIEHLPDPASVLREARRLLRPGGLLVLRWPNTTPIARALKPWAARLNLYQAPSHLFDFSRATLTRLLKQVGFHDIHSTIGGWTLPRSVRARIVSVTTGALGEMLARLTRDRFLLPGVSKTTLATRGAQCGRI
jgi:SAM-dependent methyltransferase